MATKFRSGTTTFITMKNVAASTIGDVCLLALSFTSFSPMTNPDTLRALDNVFETLIQMDGSMVTRKVRSKYCKLAWNCQALSSSFRC
jgi:Na+-transporting methylmalonyl-CoA/oxaloacetate decarboxylase beta subunit